MNGDFEPLAQTIESSKLVVDERFQRTDVNSAHGVLRTFHQTGNHWKKRSFGLAACGCGTHEQMSIATQQRVNRFRLDGSKLFPPHFPDTALHSGMQKG